MAECKICTSFTWFSLFNQCKFKAWSINTVARYSNISTMWLVSFLSYTIIRKLISQVTRVVLNGCALSKVVLIKKTIDFIAVGSY